MAMTVSTAGNTSGRFTLTFTVPTPYLSACKEAIFSAGAGQYPGSGHYTQVCFETPGIGQFMPVKGAQPNTGTIGELERVEEIKVEVLCVGREVVRRAVETMKEAHPYEEVAYGVVKLEDF
ncbi:MAG: adenine deaminase [Candelina mexicana]|nr:MAG: adenine deaminase [Candelina mexicana]